MLPSFPRTLWQLVKVLSSLSIAKPKTNLSQDTKEYSKSPVFMRFLHHSGQLLLSFITLLTAQQVTNFTQHSLLDDVHKSALMHGGQTSNLSNLDLKPCMTPRLQISNVPGAHTVILTNNKFTIFLNFQLKKVNSERHITCLQTTFIQTIIHLLC